MIPLIIEGVPRSGTRFFCKFIERQFNITIFRIQRAIRDYDQLLTEIKQNKSRIRPVHTYLEDLAKDLIIRERLGDIKNFAQFKKNIEYENLMYDLLTFKANEKGFTSWGLKFDNPSGMGACGRIFPECKFIHIIRDGRDVHLSACECLDEGYYTPYNNAIFWKKLIEERRKYGSLVGNTRYLEIHYEQLLQEPELIANKIASFIGVPNFVYKFTEIKAGNFNKWKTVMNNMETRVYEAVAGETLGELSYEKKFPNPKIYAHEKIFYRIIENPLRIKRYIEGFMKPEKRSNVIRSFKLFLQRRLASKISL